MVEQVALNHKVGGSNPSGPIKVTDLTDRNKIILETMSDINPVEILKEDRVLVSKIKKDNRKLKKEMEILLKNNRTLIELVEILENKILNMTPNFKKKYIFDYEGGGWKINGSIDKQKMELDEDITVGKINLQLAEMIRLMKIHKVKDIRRGLEINNKVLGVEPIGVKKEKS